MNEAELMLEHRGVVAELRVLRQEMERTARSVAEASRALAGPSCRLRAELERSRELLAAHGDRLAARHEALRQQAEAFDRAIRRVPNRRTQMVLQCYYGLGMTDERTAEQLDMSARSVNRVRNRWLATHGGRARDVHGREGSENG